MPRTYRSLLQTRSPVFNKLTRTYEQVDIPQSEKTPAVTAMPPGGSKKGERRGELKRKAKSYRYDVKHAAPSAAAPKKKGLPKGVSGNPNGRPKGGKNKKTMERLEEISRDLGIDQKNGIMPKKMLLEISRIFYSKALQDQAKMEALEAPDVEVSAAFERHLVLAGDHAYKAASF